MEIVWKKIIILAVSIPLGILIIAAAVFVITRRVNTSSERERVSAFIKSSNENYKKTMKIDKGMKITTVIENYKAEGDEGLEAAHGLCFYIEWKGKKILFDTGPPGPLLPNAKTLGIDLASVDLVVISHGHYDHGGGLPDFLKINKNAKIYLSTHAAEEHYIKLFGFYKKDIGLNSEMLEQHKDRFVFINAFTEIEKGLSIITDIKRSFPMPKNKGLVKRKADGGIVPDDFNHEIVFIIQESDGLIVFSGCSHNGALNITDTVMKRYPKTPIKAVIGGFHLINPVLIKIGEKREDVISLGKKLLTFPVEKYYTGHCTGGEAYGILKSVLKEKLEYFSTGSSFRIF